MLEPDEADDQRVEITIEKVNSTACSVAQSKCPAAQMNCTPFVRQYGILFRNGCFCMSKGQRKYNGTQKVEIIKRIHRENLSFKGASREYGISDRTLRDWERIYWEEGEEALLVERRGRACAASGTQKGRKPKLGK